MARAIVRFSLESDSGNSLMLRNLLERSGFRLTGTSTYSAEGDQGLVTAAIGSFVNEIPPTLDHVWIYIDNPEQEPGQVTDASVTEADLAAWPEGQPH